MPNNFNNSRPAAAENGMALWRPSVHGCQMAIAKFFILYVFCPSDFKDYGFAMLCFKI